MTELLVPLGQPATLSLWAQLFSGGSLASLTYEFFQKMGQGRRGKERDWIWMQILTLNYEFFLMTCACLSVTINHWSASSTWLSYCFWFLSVQVILRQPSVGYNETFLLLILNAQSPRASLYWKLQLTFSHYSIPQWSFPLYKVPLELNFF